jgi:glycosyltransferase involved in cell wall biosynthesis
MRIVLDLQGAQTESRFIGIGRYSLSLAKAIARNNGNHEILIALNGLFPETIEAIRSAFEGLLSQENVRVWYAPGPVSEFQPENAWRREAAERIREAFIASLKPDLVFITSLFEGYNDDAVTSIGIFDRKTMVVAFHNSIPTNDHENQDLGLAYERHYLKKVEYLKRANGWFAVSKSAAEDAIKALDLCPDQVFHIPGACDESFRPIEIQAAEQTEILRKYGISKPFLMCNVGEDIGNNLHHLLRAYGRLSPDLRNSHQLVVTGKFSSDDIQSLKNTAGLAGLSRDELVPTGYIPDEELIILYNLCRLFVFPSWQKSFGLSVIEAMACGAPVIAANTAALVDIIGREDAFFDPLSEDAIASKIKKVLENSKWREELRKHGLQQSKKFSWDESAKKAIEAFESVHSDGNPALKHAPMPVNRPRLAYLSPLPPERSGISDYSAELLPELARYYDIEVIVDQAEVDDIWIKSCLPIRSVDYFKKNAHRFDRVLYHIGNSPFHQHMFDMLDSFPGVVVMHDFYLGHVRAHLEHTGYRPGDWTKALYESHGYRAVYERFHMNNSKDTSELIFRYPCNFDIIQKALGIIVHSAYSSKLAQEWYGEGDDWVIIPHLRSQAQETDRIEARRRLGIARDSIVVCSFGILGPAKQNHRLLEAWKNSILARDPRCQLIFVGEIHHGSEYGRELIENIRQSGLQQRVRITGWVDSETFKSYLEAASIAVQLRTLSRGETSGTILDCMNFGLPTIANAHGSMAEMPKDAIYMLPDEFSDDELIEALETLGCNAEKREAMGALARDKISSLHAPAACARQYAQAIESFYDKSQNGIKALIGALAGVDGMPADGNSLTALAASIGQSLPRKRAGRQILVDVSALVNIDLKAGTERVTKSVLKNLLLDPPPGYMVEPVYAASAGNGYSYARRFALGLLDCPSVDLPDDLVEYQAGDMFLGLDLNQHAVITHVDYLKTMRDAGVRIYFVVYDLLPILLPEAFPPGTDEIHKRWLESLYQVAEGVVCISSSVADEFAKWLKANDLNRPRPFKIDWFHMGADIESSAAARELPSAARQVLAQISAYPSFLMVGTIEPRKGYLQTIEAFDMLWSQGINANLVIVGREGWKEVPQDMRRTIPEIVNSLRQHSELGKRLLWLEDISDDYLKKIYEASTCLIAASEGEGFGLPLIEAAQHKLPIIARDIPVFREVAGEHAYYFNGNEPSDLADAIVRWLELFRSGNYQKSDEMRWLTWSQSTKMLLEKILPELCSASGQCDQSPLAGKRKRIQAVLRG